MMMMTFICSTNYLEEGGGRTLAEALRLNSKVTSLDLGGNGGNGLGEGGGWTLAEALRVNTTLTSLDDECVVYWYFIHNLYTAVDMPAEAA
jgi:hypothetical protein